MSKKTTDQKTESPAETKAPVVLKDGELDDLAVVGANGGTGVTSYYDLTDELELGFDHKSRPRAQVGVVTS